MAEPTLAQMLQQMPSDMDGYSEDQAYRGRWRDPSYRSGAVEHAIGPVDFLTPMGVGGGLGGIVGYGAGKVAGKGGAILSDLLFPNVSAMAGLAGRAGSDRAAGKIGGAIGGGIGGLSGVMTGNDFARNKAERQFSDYMEPMLPPRPTYPKRPPDTR